MSLAAQIELHHFPSIQYFTKFLKYPTIIIEQHENYKKGSYRNRCIIASANGPLTLSVPLKKGKNQQQHIKEVTISYDTNWQKKHWKAIRSAYGKSPFFEYYETDIRPFFEKEFTSLFDYNRSILELLLDLVGIPKNIEFSKTYQVTTTDTDLRNKISPKTDYSLNDNTFKAKVYEQVFYEKNGFLENLSILDLLFCRGPESILILEASIIDSAF